VYVQDKRSDRPGGDVYAGGDENKMDTKTSPPQFTNCTSISWKKKKKEDGIKR
jgi:hypothetical protein